MKFYVTESVLSPDEVFIKSSIKLNEDYNFYEDANFCGEVVPDYVRCILNIPGIIEITVCQDLIGVHKASLHSWQNIICRLEKSLQHSFAGDDEAFELCCSDSIRLRLNGLTDNCRPLKPKLQLTFYSCGGHIYSDRIRIDSSRRFCRSFELYDDTDIYDELEPACANNLLNISGVSGIAFDKYELIISKDKPSDWLAIVRRVLMVLKNDFFKAEEIEVVDNLFDSDMFYEPNRKSLNGLILGHSA